MFKSSFARVSVIAGIIAAIGAIFYFVIKGKAEKKNTNMQYDIAYSAFISSYTAGVISVESDIKIRLNQGIDDSTLIGEEIDVSLFEFDPAIKGKAVWSDYRTISFHPETWLERGEVYEATFQLGKIKEVPEALKTFTYRFQTIEQNFELSIGNLGTKEGSQLREQYLQGIVHTADIAKPEQLEKMVSAKQNGKSLPVKWEHSGETDNDHRFIIQDIQRKEKSGKVSLTLSGKPLGIDKKENESIEIPALGDFKLVDAKVVQGNNQYILLQFSDPLKADQNLNGLITLESGEGLDFIVDDNEIAIYPKTRPRESQKLRLSPGIQNILGYKTKKNISRHLTFEQPKPELRFTGKGVILPGTEGLVLPFEAISLKAVEVEVIKIFENNIVQFLQTNNLSGHGQLRRVGRPILKKNIPLKGSGITDFSKWNRYTLSLTELIAPEPGAIYQVKIDFRKAHTLYYCDEGKSGTEDLEIDPEDNLRSWDEYDEYDDYYYDYDWSERDNPCNVAFYRYRTRSIQRNILASDLGIIGKRGNNGNLVVAVTDIKSTLPKSGVSIEVYDYQQQSLASGSTDKDGLIKFDLKKAVPFLIVASAGKQKGYLKLGDGNALSMSNFDVAGEAIQEGIKGFLYGDRGVWRPGDSLHLNFMLEDKQKLLPEAHPVVFQLFDPNGQRVQRLVRSTSKMGLYNFSTATDEDAPTGNWSAEVRVGGAKFSKKLKIETVKPNRLKINLDFGREKAVIGDDDLSGDLEVKWLHGAPAKGLKAEFDVVLQESKTGFPGYETYKFDDPSRSFYGEQQKVFEGRIDEEGHAQITTSLHVEGASPGMLKAYFSGKVFEEGGNFSVDRFTLPYYPYHSFVGMRLPESKSWSRLFYNKENTVEMALVDTDGKALSGRKIDISVFRLEWHWWWDDYEESVANYIRRNNLSPVTRGSIRTNSKGKASWDFSLERWGRYFVQACDPESGHCTGQVEYTSWGGENGTLPGGASMLAFSSDKDRYDIGEEVSITLPSSSKGRALVSIESGSESLKTFWVETQKGSSSFSFKATANMAPNVYVSISLLQEHAQTANDLPIRMYGTIPVKIEDPATHLEPVISMSEVLAPEGLVQITVSEASNKEMSYTVAMVDEGLLDLTRFKTPSPWNTFYAREALGVKTWDIYEEVIGAYGGKLERLLAIGGDGEGDKSSGSKANRFKPVVKFLGPFTLAKGAKVTHTFRMPQYIGSVRTMVVAGHEGAYGHAEKTTPVRQSLMVLGTLPRVLGPGEEVKLPVNVFVSDEQLKNVTVTVKANDMLIPVGPKTQQVRFSKVGDQVVDFGFRVKPQLGVAKVRIVASAGGKETSHDIELNVRNPNPPMTKVIEAVVEAGRSWQKTVQAVGMKGTNTATMEVSSIPPINLSKRLGYLMQYPHGCIEQTTSSVFPQLYLEQLTTLDAEDRAAIESNIKAGIERLKKFQRSEGGFSYWPGDEDTNSWGSNYAGHFLLEAKAKGYPVPETMLRQWRKFQKRKASAWRSSNAANGNDLIQAYRLYTLALAGTAELGAMNRMREIENLSNQAKWRLASAFVKAGQKDAATSLISTATVEVGDYTYNPYTYGSAWRDKAMILETLDELNENTKAVSLVQQISEALSKSDYWMSTQTTAYCLKAIAAFSGKGSKVIRFDYVLNKGKTIATESKTPLLQEDIDIDAKGSSDISLKNTSSGILFVRLILEGTPLRGQENPEESNLKLSVVYQDKEGKTIDPTTMEQGTDFVAEVTVSNPGYKGLYKDMALTQIFPSGWEIHNARMEGLDDFYQSSKPDYQDIRDDRVYTYFDLRANEKKTFRIMLNATYAGEYYLPATSCEAMYDNSISAATSGRTVNVVKTSTSTTQ